MFATSELFSLVVVVFVFWLAAHAETLKFWQLEEQFVRADLELECGQLEPPAFLVLWIVVAVLVCSNHGDQGEKAKSEDDLEDCKLS